MEGQEVSPQPTLTSGVVKIDLDPGVCNLVKIYKIDLDPKGPKGNGWRGRS